MSDRFDTGTVAYDVGQEPSKAVLVTDDDCGTISDQADAMRELILDNDTNQAFPMTPDTHCVEVTYLGLSGSSDKTYTMPETRIAVPQVTTGETDLTPAEVSAVASLKSLFAAARADDERRVSDLIDLCKDSDVSDNVVRALASAFSDEIAAEAREP
jgi:hypothetical protein